VLASLLVFFLVASLVLRPTRLLRPIKAMVRLMCRAFGWRIRVVGGERMDPSRSYLLMSNHLSNFDHFIALGYLPGYMVGLEKVETLKVPVYGWAARRWGQLHVDRNDLASAIVSCKMVEQRLAEGVNVVVYPEGTRSRDGRLQPFKKGPFHIAVDSQAVILPIVLKGLHELLPKGRMLVAPGEVELHVAEPIPPTPPGPDARQVVADRVRAAFLRELGEEEPGLPGREVAVRATG
jgi:1-acyl-sn-glycerol-3-phosphate acyltransferase